MLKFFINKNSKIVDDNEAIISIVVDKQTKDILRRYCDEKNLNVDYYVERTLLKAMEEELRSDVQLHEAQLLPPHTLLDNLIKK